MIVCGSGKICAYGYGANLSGAFSPIAVLVDLFGRYQKRLTLNDCYVLGTTLSCDLMEELTIP